MMTCAYMHHVLSRNHINIVKNASRIFHFKELYITLDNYVGYVAIP